MRACRKCWYWEGSGSVGECRKNPPTQDPDNLLGEFPRTNNDSWCGEFKADSRKDDPMEVYEEHAEREIGSLADRLRNGR